MNLNKRKGLTGNGCELMALFAAYRLFINLNLISTSNLVLVPRKFGYEFFLYFLYSVDF